jgi:hypothetical protein
MTSINNSIDITHLQTNRSEQHSFNTTDQVKSGTIGKGEKESQPRKPQILNDTLGHALKNLLVVDNIKDTTGAILDKMKAQIEGKGINLPNLDQAGAASKSLQLGQDISIQGNLGLVQANREFLRQFQE